MKIYPWSAVTGTEKTIIREKNISDIYREKKALQKLELHNYKNT